MREGWWTWFIESLMCILFGASLAWIVMAGAGGSMVAVYLMGCLGVVSFVYILMGGGRG